MNLMKLFNLKYLKENIKKSKGLLAFCLGVVPLINFLVLIIHVISLDNRLEILDFPTVSTITFLGLFIIPFIIAVSLFGFVFKRKSVDFVLSKPISRRSIYLTNIIGGIILITIFMLLNSLIYILFGLIFSNLIIPISLIVDYFILFLVSYIFIFIVSSLAITISGNLMGSIVLILIIICLSPLLHCINVLYSDFNPSTVYLECTNESCKPSNYKCHNDACINHLRNNEYKVYGTKIHELTFTAPFYSLESFQNNTFYSSKSIIKMLVLIPIYSVIGYYLFKKRKMENNETSFKNSKVHYFVKGITIIPVSFICYLIIKDASEIGILVSIFIILIYSIVYDLITRKEIYQVLKSSAISLSTLAVFLGIYGIYDLKMNNHSVTIKDINEIVMEGISIKSKNNYQVFNENITGQELIDRLIRETLEPNSDKGSRKYFNVTTKQNQKYNLGFYWTNDTNKIIKEILRQEKLAYFKELNYNQINYVDAEIKPTKKIKELIKETMLNIDKYSYEENESLLEVAIYRNHKYEKFYIMPMLNKELDKYVLNEKNKLALKFLENADHIEFSTSNSNFDQFNYVINANKKQFLKYLSTNNNEITASAFNIYAQKDHTLLILIGNRESFIKEYETYEKNLQNDPDYQELLENSKNNNTKKEDIKEADINEKDNMNNYEY